MKRLLAYAGVAAALAGPAVAATQTVWTVTNREVFVNGQRFLMRGVGYQPTPIGENPSAAPPYGDYFTTNHAALFDRDMANLRGFGANTVRIYGWNAASNHSAFLARAWNGGDRPVYVLLNQWINPWTDWSSTAAVASVCQAYTALATNGAAFPAVMGVAIGNELNAQNGNGSNPAFWSAMNRVAAAVKAAAPGKLTTFVSAEGLDAIAAYDGVMTNLDAWSLQIYRGRTFGTLFATYTNASARPMFVTEFGIDAYDATAGAESTNHAAIAADHFESLWLEMLTNRAACSGGCVFEYADEWWKASGSASAHDAGGFANGNFPDGTMNEEWWGIYAVATNAGGGANVLTPRAMEQRLRDFWLVPAAPLSAGVVTNRLRSSFARPLKRPDLVFQVSASTNLLAWTPMASGAGGAAVAALSNSGAVVVESAATGDVRTVTVEDPQPPAAGSGRFHLLEVHAE